MEEIVNGLIEKVDSFGVKSEFWKDLKKDTRKELKNKPTVDNQNLWMRIKEIAIFMDEYVG